MRQDDPLTGLRGSPPSHGGRCHVRQRFSRRRRPRAEAARETRHSQSRAPDLRDERPYVLGSAESRGRRGSARFLPIGLQEADPTEPSPSYQESFAIRLPPLDPFVNQQPLATCSATQGQPHTGSCADCILRCVICPEDDGRRSFPGIGCRGTLRTYAHSSPPWLSVDRLPAGFAGSRRIRRHVGGATCKGETQRR